MSDLISRSVIWETLEMEHALGITNDDIAEAFRDAPTIDAAQVIRCADCAYYGKSPLGHPHIGWCRIDCKHRRPEFFCANGDRK